VLNLNHIKIGWFSEDNSLYLTIFSESALNKTFYFSQKKEEDILFVLKYK
jgi:hypothetical protein